MKLRYTRAALRELDEILTFVSERSPQGARSLGRRIYAITQLLVRHPGSGNPTSAARIRRIAATPYPYFIFYEATENEVTVIDVRHAARDPDSMPGSDL